MGWDRQTVRGAPLGARTWSPKYMTSNSSRLVMRAKISFMGLECAFLSLLRRTEPQSPCEAFPVRVGP